MTSTLPTAAIHDAQQGEPAARRQLVEAMSPVVWWALCRTSRDPEDAYQAAWERVFRSLPRFRLDGPASLATWIATLTHRELIDRHRRLRRRPEVALVVDIASADDPERAVVSMRRAVRFQRALQALPEAQRRLLVAHYLGGVPLKTLAEDEGVALGTIKSRLYRAKAALAVQARSPDV